MNNNPEFRPAFKGACRHHHKSVSAPCRASGFTLIELVIVIAVIAILLSLAVPAYQIYTVRAKIAEGLGIAAAAKTAVSATCQENPELTGLTNVSAGFEFGVSEYVEDIEISGDCDKPEILVITRNTGAPNPPPEMLLTGDFPVDQGRVTWACSSPNAPDHLVPDTCRS